MKHNKLIINTLLLLGFGLTGLQAQQSVITSGSNASGNGGTVTYSVGQVVYTTNTGSNGLVVPGVQQPFEISIVTGFEKAKGINLTVTAYPNPTTDFLILEVKELKQISVCFQLCDMQGKILQNEKIISTQTSISMRNLVSATYFVKVIEGNRVVRIFKIIKK